LGEAAGSAAGMDHGFNRIFRTRKAACAEGEIGDVMTPQLPSLKYTVKNALLVRLPFFPVVTIQ
jgi:hypothetical protein